MNYEEQKFTRMKKHIITRYHWARGFYLRANTSHLLYFHAIGTSLNRAGTLVIRSKYSIE